MTSKKENIDFGIVLTLVLLVIGAVWHVTILNIIAIVTLLITAQIPVLYTPFSWLWFKLAKFIEMFVSIIIMSIIFYSVVTPVGLLRRLFAKDNLQLRNYKASMKSVFIVKNTTYRKEDLENQF